MRDWHKIMDIKKYLFLDDSRVMQSASRLHMKSEGEVYLGAFGWNIDYLRG